MEKLETIFYTTIIGIIIVFGAGMYMTGSVSHAPAQNATSSANSYNITLVITTNNYLTSVNHNQPAYFVLTHWPSLLEVMFTAESFMMNSVPFVVPMTLAYVEGTFPGPES